jgi:uncharacterized protein YdaU (DUF1376 family)
MSKADTWMPFYVADYVRATMRLTRDQHGAYFLLLLACWDGGGRLPNEPGQLAAIVKATPAEWRKLAPVILPYFEDHGAYLVHDRVVKEHAKAARLSEVRRESGLKGGRPPKQNESNQKPIGSAKANQTGLQTETPSPSPLPVRLYPQPVEVIEPSVSGQAAPTKGARLKPNWRPSADNYAYAVKEGFTVQQVDAIAEDFRDFWTAKSGADAVKLDWSATWRRWIREQKKRRPAWAPAAQKRVSFV